MASKISCYLCGRIHDRNYICAGKIKKQIEKSKNNNNRTDAKIYNTTKWKKLRDNILQEYNTIDLFNYYVIGKVDIADNVHHIVEICDNQDMAYDWENLIPLREYTHKKIVHKIYKYNIEIKKELQQMLIDMLEDWNKGKRELRSYNERFNLLLSNYNCKNMFNI